jgi:outer membrane protein assembly factor BamB
MNMKITTQTLASIIIYLTVFLHASTTVCRAQSETDPASMVVVSTMPTTGSFWSMQLTNYPPLPYDPYPNLSLYTDGTPGNYYYDDRDIDYSALGVAMNARSSRFHSGEATSDDLPSLPDGGGTNDSGGGEAQALNFTPPASGYVPCETWTNFWLEIAAGSGDIYVTISNTLPGMSYNLLEKTNLNAPVWVPIQTLTATGSSTAASPVSAGTNVSLFFTATLTNDQPPLITVPPSNEVVALGGTAVFTVTATGLAPLGYQWQFNGTNMSGKTASNLTIASVQSTNVGAYTVIVANVICEASATAGLGLIWSNYLGAGIDASPAISENGEVFIATTGSMLWALNASGTVKWSNSVTTGQDGDITSSAALAADGSAVYIGTQDSTGSYLDAFNPTNGTILWSNFLGGYVNSSPAVSAGDGTIYLTTTDGSTNGLFSINPATHAINWLFQTDDAYKNGSPSDSSPAVGPDCTVYFLANNDLYAVSPNGQLAWFFPLPANATPNASPAIDAAGNVMLGSSDGYVYCISPSGGLQWIFDTGTGSTINSSIAVGSGGLVVAATQSGVLFAITNGVSAWQWTNSSSAAFLSSPAISQNNEVIIGSEDNSVYAITNGVVKWSRSTAGLILSSPAISPLTGAVVIGSEDGYVYSLAGVGGLAANAPWPMFHANPRHTGATPNPSCVAGASLVAFPNNPSLDTNAGTFSFYVSGTPASLWAIYASSNLTDWSVPGSVTLDSTGVGTFNDNDVAGVTNRFYQARNGNECSPVIGFINITIPPGTNLIANQLYQVNDSEYPQNTANGLLQFLANSGYSYPYLPDQSLLMNWNGAGFDVDTYIAR